MGWIIAGGVLGVLLLALLLPVRLTLAFRQTGWQANLTVEVRYGFLRFTRPVDLTDKVSMVVEHMWKRWQDKGVAVKPDLQETVRKAPRQKLIRAAMPALRRLGRSTRCRLLRLRVEVGGADAMDSALLAGSIWSGAGMLVGLVSRAVRLPKSAVSVAVIPRFQEPVWQAEVECILAVRLGKAIMAIVWLLRQELSRKEVIAWVRDSLRRKGDQTSGRTPDSRPDEDGHGKP